MDFDFGKFFDDAGEKAQAALGDLVKVGVPAVQASLEQWGIDVLKKQQEQTQSDLNTAVKDVMAQSPQPGSFGAALSTTIKGTILETHGLMIVLGIVALIAVGFVLKGK